MQCIFDALSVLIGYFAGGPQEQFYRIFTAMMIIVAYVYYNTCSCTNIHVCNSNKSEASIVLFFESKARNFGRRSSKYLLALSLVYHNKRKIILVYLDH